MRIVGVITERDRSTNDDAVAEHIQDAIWNMLSDMGFSPTDPDEPDGTGTVYGCEIEVVDLDLPPDLAASDMGAYETNQAIKLALKILEGIDVNAFSDVDHASDCINGAIANLSEVRYDT